MNMIICVHRYPAVELSLTIEHLTVCNVQQLKVILQSFIAPTLTIKFSPDVEMLKHQNQFCDPATIRPLIVLLCYDSNPV